MTLMTLVLIAATAQADWTPPADATPMPTTTPSAEPLPLSGTAPADVATPTRYETGSLPATTSAVAPTPAPTPAEPAARTPAARPSTGTVPFEQRLVALELALSTIVVESPSLWRFDRLDSEAAELLTLASNDAQRNAVRDVAARLDNFRRLGVKLRGGADDASGWRSPSQVAIAPASRRSAPTQLTPSGRLEGYASSAPRGQDTRGHDASGVLRPVVSQRPDAPKYAVIDDEGRIAALVTPTPEIDARLKGMVGQRVGLDGQRGYRTDLRRDHVVAERVTPLDTLRR